jgi:8-oxo-dGTP pyrophosphatase MutT (NUDIX family)
MREVLQRRAVRAIIVTPEGELLLIRVRSPHGQVFWITPGGGIEGDESAEAALQRELREELGLEDFHAGPIVWRRHHTFSWGEQRIAQREEFRIVHAERFEASMGDPTEAAFATELRWWPVAELAQATERLAPPSLATIVGDYLRRGAPLELPPEEVTED